MRTQGRYVLGCFDLPIYRDWVFWWSVAMGVFFSYTTLYAASSSASSSAPKWADALLAGVFGFWIMGLPVALVRRGARAFRSRSATPSSPRPQSPPASGPDRMEDPTRLASLPPPSPPMSPPPPPIAVIPVPLSGYAGTAPGTSAAVERARTSLPYPIARAARALHVNTDPLEQHRLILDVAEAVSESLGALATSWLREHRPNDPALEVINRAFYGNGVSQGHWHEVIAAAQREMEQDPEIALRGYVTGVAKSGKQPGLLADLATLVEERNRSAHGARPHTRVEAAVRVSEFLPVVERALARVSFMSKLSWVLVESVAYRRQDRKFVVQVGVAMNDHPEFEPRTMVLGQPLANETFYVLVDELDTALDLTPLVVVRYCETCHQPEVFFADRIFEKKGVSLKSIGRGHQMFDQALIAEFDLFSGRRRDADGHAG